MKEQWRPVVGFWGYEVSNLGRVRSWRPDGGKKSGRLVRDEPKIRKLVVSLYGYATVMFKENGHCVLRTVHRLVLEAFVGMRPSGREARHLDGKPLNNCVANLAWGTREEQFADQVRHGTDSRGERNGAAKLSFKEARAIRKSTRSGQELARVYGVSQATISRIRHGQRYSSV
jgi:hypothetical protein